MRMPGNCKASPILLSLVFFFFTGPAFAPGQTSSPTPPPAKNVQSPVSPAAAALPIGAPPPEVSKSVGAETCKTCHEEIYNAW